ncbi:hypothetical protein BKA70DRAFT_1439396 [Coprinopsis sp. MPI-PUGE-AT-0042]|nr:hypothetical protein BKA70DRAFT_1439396 [Coprinopsis sp. MPI-PUGE-AT-0042]
MIVIFTIGQYIHGEFALRLSHAMLVMSKWVSLIGTQQYSGRATRETGLLSLQASTGESTAVLLVSAGVTDISSEQQPLVFTRLLKQLAHASTIPVLLQTHSLSVIDIRGARGQWLNTLKDAQEPSSRC